MGSLFTRLTTYEKQLTGGRGKFDVAYGSQETRNTIERWISAAGWKLSDFGKFLESMGIKTPVVLYQFEKSRKSFSCMSILTGATCKLRLFYTNELPDNAHQIWLTTVDRATSKYEIISSLQEQGKIKRRIYLRKKEIEIKKECLYNEFKYSPFFLDIKFHLQDNTFLYIHVDEPMPDGNMSMSNTENSKILNPEIPAKIETYLYELDESLSDKTFDAIAIYKEFVKIIGYTAEEIGRIERFVIEKKNHSESEENWEGDAILAAYCENRGKAYEYGIQTKEGETFLVYSDGSWNYHYGDKKMLYAPQRVRIPELKKEKGFEGEEGELLKIRVNNQVKKMMKTFE